MNREFNKNKYEDLTNILDLIEKTKYLHEKSDIREKTDNLSLKIVSFFVENNNIKSNTSDLSKANRFKDYSLDQITNSVRKLNEDGTLVKKTSSGSKAKNITEALNSHDYKLDDKVYKFQKMAFNIADEIEQIKGTLDGDEIIKFSNYLEQFIDILDGSYKGKQVDFNQLNIESKSIFELLFEENTGLYKSIATKTENLEESVARLKDAVSVIENQDSIYDIVSEFRKIINQMHTFIEDINKRVDSYITNIKYQFSRLKQIHLDSSYDLKAFYSPVIESSPNLFIGKTKDDAIKTTIETINGVLYFEESRSNVFKNIEDSLFDQIVILYEISNDLIKSSEIIESQIYFRNIAINIEDDASSSYINKEIDSYFTTSKIEHFSVNDDNTVIEENSRDKITFSLRENKKKRKSVRKKVSLNLSVEEKQIIENEKKIQKQRREQRNKEIKALFVDGVFVNKELEEKDWFFIKDTYYNNISEFEVKGDHEEFTYFYNHMPGISFIFKLWDSDEDYILKTNNAKFILPNKYLEIQMIEG